MAKGAAWMVAFKLSERSIGLVSTLILARLLMPSDFGMVALATSFVAVLELLASFNFDVVLIQNPNAEGRHYNTAWTLNVLLHFACGLLLVALAVPVARFYGELRLPAVMAFLALGSMIQGLQNIGVVAFQKDLELHKEFNFQIIKKITGFVVTTTLAIVLRNYWALIAGMLTTRLVGVALSYAYHPYRPRFSLAAYREMFNYSRWLFVNNVLFFLNNRSADFIVGKIAGSHGLGLYSVSYEISNLPTTELSAPINRAVFPAYSRMSRDPAVLRKGFLDVITTIVMFALPAGAGIAATAGMLVPVVLGDKWLQAIGLIQVLAFFGILNAMQGNTTYLFLAMGQPKTTTYLTSARVAVLISLLYVLVRKMGVAGSAWAFLVTELVMTPMVFITVSKKLGLSFEHLHRVLLRPCLATVVMFWSVRCLERAWPGPVEVPFQLLRLGTALLLGFVAYSAVVLVLWNWSSRPEGPEKYLLGRASFYFRNWLGRTSIEGDSKIVESGP